MFHRVANILTEHTALVSVDLNLQRALFVVIGQTDECNSNTHRFVLVDKKKL
jgi:hypothetical protein